MDDLPSDCGATRRPRPYRAAYAQPQLRALFPFHSHRSLNFSRCTGFPYTNDVPVVTPVDGKYRVTWWKTRSPHGPADIGETDNPRDAVALVVAHLPPECGRQSLALPMTLTSQIPHNVREDVAQVMLGRPLKSRAMPRGSKR